MRPNLNPVFPFTHKAGVRLLLYPLVGIAYYLYMLTYGKEIDDITTLGVRLLIGMGIGAPINLFLYFTSKEIIGEWDSFRKIGLNILYDCALLGILIWLPNSVSPFNSGNMYHFTITLSRAIFPVVARFSLLFTLFHASLFVGGNWKALRHLPEN